MTTVTVTNSTVSVTASGASPSTVSVTTGSTVAAQVSTLNFEDLADVSAWVEWTPTLLFDATPVATAEFGNGSRAMQRGAYVNVGPMTFFTFRFEWDGTGIVQPSGTAILTLPNAARDDMDVIRVGMGTLYDASAAELYTIKINGGNVNGVLGLPDGTIPSTVAVMEAVGQSFDGTFTHNSPWGGAADGDILHGSGWYWRDT